MSQLGASRSLLGVLALAALALLGGAAYLYLNPPGGGTVTVTTITTVITGAPSPSTAPSPSPSTTEATSTSQTQYTQLPTTSLPSTTEATSTATQGPSTSPPETSAAPSTYPISTTAPSTSPTLTLTPVTSPRTLTPTTTRTITPADAVRARLANPSVVWFAVDGGKRILQYDSSNGQVSQVIYVDIRIDTFTPHVGIREKIYFADANGNKIYLYLQPSASGPTSPSSITVVLNHTTYVRCIRFGPDPEVGFRMYFSEASGAGGGLIYRIVRNLPQTFMRIDPRDFDGYWAGYFEFGRNDTLYLSNGNRIPSSIYEVRGGRVTKLATFGFPVLGMDYVENARVERLATPRGEVTVSRGLLFADHGSRIYLYDLTNGNLYVIFDDGSYGRIVDVGVPPP